MRRTTRRGPPPRDSYLPPPPTPQFSATSSHHPHPHHRDSDASFTSSRQSHSHSHPNPSLPQITDSSYKHTALRSINAYLSSHSFHITLSLKPLPSSKDLTDTLRFLLSRLHFDLNPSRKLEDDLVLVLKFLNCPLKVNKSAFRAPGAPHSFPLILAVIHWLVQLSDFNDHLRSSDETSDRFRKDSIMAYCMESYLSYMNGDDEAVEALDKEFSEKMEEESRKQVEELNSMDEQVKKLQAELNALTSMPSERETFESQGRALEADLEKFQEYVASVRDANAIKVRALEDKEKERAAKVAEITQTKEENEELKKRVEAQGINMREADRMKRELLAVEREISEAEVNRSSWEEKGWDLDSAIGQKFKELEALSIEGNQALRRLKLGGDYQYMLNAKGSTPAEVLGIDYKSTLKPAIKGFADDIKKNTTAKFEEFIALQQYSKEMTAKIEAKRNRLAVLQSHIDERQRQLERTRTEIDEYSIQCATEAEKIVGNMEAEAHNLVMMESEAVKKLQDTERRLQEETKKNEEETQLCAYELFALIDSVSRYKESVEKKISEMGKDLSETTEAISIAYRNTLFS